MIQNNRAYCGEWCIKKNNIGLHIGGHYVMRVGVEVVGGCCCTHKKKTIKNIIRQK